ncbi:hypothetical protein LJK87_35320 [Paenibacillus sp. P25]|nr:hypothetical protein LJK87_35320 [Paenibacillus sp. P25]
MTAGTLLLVTLYLLLPHLPSVGAVAAGFFFVFIVAGISFPLMMGSLVSLSPTIRGTITSLSNSVMYAAATVGSWFAGSLYAGFNGFAAVSLFTALCLALSLVTFLFSGVLAVQPKESRKLAS